MLRGLLHHKAVQHISKFNFKNRENYRNKNRISCLLSQNAD